MRSLLHRADQLTRRNFVERCAMAAFGLSVLPAIVRGAEPARGPGFGKAKNVIFLQLLGGMSHIDTFDPKEGGSKGPGDPLKTKGGFAITEYLPKIAGIADKICVIRSMTAKVGVHASAQYLIRTGYDPRGTIMHPILGAWAQHYLGASHKTLPSSVCVNRAAAHGNGFFSSSHSPLPIFDPTAGLQNAGTPEGAVEIEKRLKLVNELDQTFRAKFPDENVNAYTEFYDNTLRLMKSSDLKAFDLNAETAEKREAYGKSKFGQGCLLARRLVESGVRFVEVVSSGWDMHNNLEDAIQDHGSELDQGFSALVSDLDSRGMLDSTLVVIATEFGRKPDFDGNGRGHYPKVFSTVLAGGGVKRGLVYGASDKRGAEPSEKPVSIGSFHATIGWAAGLPLEKEVQAPNGRPFTIGNKAKPIADVFA